MKAKLLIVAVALFPLSAHAYTAHGDQRDGTGWGDGGSAIGTEADFCHWHKDPLPCELICPCNIHSPIDTTSADFGTDCPVLSAMTNNFGNHAPGTFGGPGPIIAAAAQVVAQLAVTSDSSMSIDASALGSPPSLAGNTTVGGSDTALRGGHGSAGGSATAGYRPAAIVDTTHGTPRVAANQATAANSGKAPTSATPGTTQADGSGGMGAAMGGSIGGDASADAALAAAKAAGASGAQGAPGASDSFNGGMDGGRGAAGRTKAMQGTGEIGVDGPGVKVGTPGGVVLDTKSDVFEAVRTGYRRFKKEEHLND